MPSPLTPTPLKPNCEVEPGNQWHHIDVRGGPTNSTPHTVSDGENWQKIAADPRYRGEIVKYREAMADTLMLDPDLPEELANARALIYFNFHTTVPEYVNWYLLNYVCCYSATEDRFNRRFSSTDKDRKSPMFGKIARAGKVYIPKAFVSPKTDPLPDVRKVSFWAHVAYQDGLMKQLGSLIGTTGSANTWLERFEDLIRKKGVDFTPSQKRTLARVIRFARPIRKVLKYAGWAGKAIDWVISVRVVTGYLVMTYEKPFDTHYSWKLDLALRGDEVLGESEGEFSTKKDTYSIRTSVFDPTREWVSKDVSCTFAFNSLAMTVKRAFKMRPNDRRYRAITDRVVHNRSPLDFTLNLPPLTTQAKYGFFNSIDHPWSGQELSDGKFRSFTTIAGPLL